MDAGLMAFCIFMAIVVVIVLIVLLAVALGSVVFIYVGKILGVILFLGIVVVGVVWVLSQLADMFI